MNTPLTSHPAKEELEKYAHGAGKALMAQGSGFSFAGKLGFQRSEFYRLT